MSAEDTQTQYRSTSGRLDPPLPRDSWIGTPYEHNTARQNKGRKGYISLEIRRLRKPPKDAVSGCRQPWISGGRGGYESNSITTMKEPQKRPSSFFGLISNPKLVSPCTYSQYFSSGPRVASGKTISRNRRRFPVHVRKASRAPSSPELSEPESFELEPEFVDSVAGKQLAAPINVRRISADTLRCSFTHHFR
jgi:hypothetical protein